MCAGGRGIGTYAAHDGAIHAQPAPRVPTRAHMSSSAPAPRLPERYGVLINSLSCHSQFRPLRSVAIAPVSALGGQSTQQPWRRFIVVSGKRISLSHCLTVRRDRCSARTPPASSGSAPSAVASDFNWRSMKPRCAKTVSQSVFPLRNLQVKRGAFAVHYHGS